MFQQKCAHAIRLVVRREGGITTVALPWPQVIVDVPSEVAAASAGCCSLMLELWAGGKLACTATAALLPVTAAGAAADLEAHLKASCAPMVRCKSQEAVRAALPLVSVLRQEVWCQLARLCWLSTASKPNNSPQKQSARTSRQGNCTMC